MTRTLFRLLVVLLGISHLICLNAVPVTRTATLTQGIETSQIVEKSDMVKMEKGLRERTANGITDAQPHGYPPFGIKVENGLEERTVHGRMDVELNDYRRTGANGGHTPVGG